MIHRNGSQVRVSGRLTIDTVAGLFKNGLNPNGQIALTVDMSGVEAVDSTAVSLMLAWIREAKRSNTNLTFSNIPDNLLSLAKLYGVSDALTPHSDSASPA